MFHFPAYTPTQAMHSPAGNTTQLMLGFPIRTSSDQRLVGNSPRLNAASHVLHRPSMPRHPPYARNTKQHTLLLHTHERLQTVDTQQTTQITEKQDARVHYTVLTQHTPHTNNHHQAAISGRDATNTGTHNVAPDTQQHANTPKRFPVTVQHLVSHHTSTHIPGHKQTP